MSGRNVNVGDNNDSDQDTGDILDDQDKDRNYITADVFPFEDA